MSRTGSALDHRNVAGRVLARAVTAAGLDDVKRGDEVILRAPSFHDLRHTHASALIANGWDIEEVSSRLGHADTAITMKIYVGEFDRARRSADRRDRLARLYARGSADDDAARDGGRLRSL